MYQPLAEILRPKILTDIIGQQHLIGENKPLSLMSHPQSMILWGPPGVGKTTLARILAQHHWSCELIELPAIFSGIKDIKQVLDTAEQKYLLHNTPVVVFIDEIHRFNTTQQDAFLHHLEQGKIILIGATTANPSFALNNALLSRTHVYVLYGLTIAELELLFNKSLLYLQKNIDISEDARQLILHLADGDARRLLNLMEIIANSQIMHIDLITLEQILPNTLKQFDKNGEQFYNQISALHKSIRGSDVDAALYWFGLMLQNGTDPIYLGRRLLRIAWEDIGLADINAATVVLNALNTYDRLGSPEGELALAGAVTYLAVTPKSNSIEIAFNKVNQYIKNSPSYVVPLHLRNAPTKLMQKLNYAKNYKYAHDYPHHYVPHERYIPDDMPMQEFYQPTMQGLEQKINERLKFLKSLD